MEDEDKQKKAQQGEVSDRLNIKVSDEIAKGSYANFVIIHNNDTEFVFDFVFAEPQRRQGQVTSRVVTNPRAAKRLLVGLGEMLRLYEERFGAIDLPPRNIPKSSYH